MATCSLCAEEHPEGAATCPHCGARFSVSDARWSGDILVLPAQKLRVSGKGCVLCGAAGALSRSRRLARAPSWWLLACLTAMGPCSLPLLVMVLVRTRDQAVVELPLCDRCSGSWRTSEGLVWLFGVVGWLAFPALGFGAVKHLGLGRDAEPVALMCGWVAWAVALAGVRYAVTRRLQARLTHLAFDEVCLAFPDPAIARRVIDADDGPWRADAPRVTLPPGGRGAELPLLRRGDREGDEEVPPLR